MKRRIHSFVWGGIVAAALIAFGIYAGVTTSDFANFAFWGIVGVLSFTLVSCLILKNNFIGDMVLEVFSWGFVKMPMLIFTLDLDGILWLLTVKLLFWILGIVLALLCGLLAIVLGLIVSLFVYPFALSKNIRGVEANED